jgi:hypothetical protein
MKANPSRLRKEEHLTQAHIGGNMKTAQINLIAALMIVTLALSSFVSVSMAANNKSVTSEKRLKVLLKTAKEPADHRKIAEYYRHQAVELTRAAKEHEDLAKLYDEYPPYPGMVSKHGTDFGQGAPHCHHWAQVYAEQAKEAEALAALHEDMAKEAEQKRP